MANHPQTPNLLGEQIANRLAQLGLSRREFCRRSNLSRQTLYSLEHGSGKGFAASTFEAIDKGMKWPNGTAKGYYEGLANAKELFSGASVKELVQQYLSSILEHLYTMTVEELEREVLMLEEEMYGRSLPESAESMTVIRETVVRLTNAMLNGAYPDDVRKVKDA